MLWYHIIHRKQELMSRKINTFYKRTIKEIEQIKEVDQFCSFTITTLMW